VLSCCQRKGIEYCFECDEYPCEKYDGAGSTDSFISHKNRIRDLEKAKKGGMAAYKAELNRKIEILEELLENYNDGRRKGFYCLAVNLLELSDIVVIMEQAAVEIDLCSPIKIRAATVVRLFEEAATQKGVSLKLRK
jgi:hypothetical protein